MFKYKFIFTSILTSRNKVRKKRNSNLHPVVMTVSFPDVSSLFFKQNTGIFLILVDQSFIFFIEIRIWKKKTKNKTDKLRATVLRHNDINHESSPLKTFSGEITVCSTTIQPGVSSTGRKKQSQTKSQTHLSRLVSTLSHTDGGYNICN